MNFRRETETWAVRIEHWNPPGHPRPWGMIGIFYFMEHPMVAKFLRTMGLRTMTYRTREQAREASKRYMKWGGKAVPIKIRITVEEIGR